MNILFYQYGSICEPDIMEGFEELGFHVDSISEEIKKQVPDWQRADTADRSGSFQKGLSVCLYHQFLSCHIRML